MHNNTGSHIVLKDFKYIYFLGIGGIGMSALARYFLKENYIVGGYDKTPSDLTHSLSEQGAIISFDENRSALPSEFLHPSETLIIRTPAVPKAHDGWNFFQEKGFTILKRAEILGLLTRSYKGLAVAGTHGKTTTSSLLAHMLNESKFACNAFLGGISSNFGTNFIQNENAEYTVIEADEFDRSFLQLRPLVSIITAVDADHLDIYGDEATFRKGFEEYAQLIHADGLLIQRYGIDLPSKCKVITYAINEPKADFNAHNLRVENEQFLMDIDGPEWKMSSVVLGLPGTHNAENALACVVLLKWLGGNEEIMRNALRTFKGVKRRFDYQFKSNNIIYIDDYAHHPTELKALLDSIDLLYPNRTKWGLFQPHLFSRTRDFMEGFAEQLRRLDVCNLLDIYPAREEPIEGITSSCLLEKVQQSNKHLLQKEEVLEKISSLDNAVILTIGAGDIDRLVSPIRKKLEQTA